MAGYKYRGPDVVAKSEINPGVFRAASSLTSSQRADTRNLATRRRHARRMKSRFDDGKIYERGVVASPAERKIQKRYEGPRRVAPPAVGKRLVDEEHRTSLPRALLAGTGMGAIAWGGSRGKILGRGLRLGATHPDIDAGLRRAFAAAELARSSTESATRPLGRIAGRGYGHLPPNVRASLDRVPPGLRPATSALVGAIMVDHARPVRRTTYRPVVID